MGQLFNQQPKIADKAARAQLKTQLAEYLAQQPEATLSSHKWMKCLEAAGLGVIVAAFAWTSTNPVLIPTAWFVFAASPVFWLVFLELDAIVLHAFPPVVLPGKPQKFVTGNGAMWIGSATLVGGLLLATFWIAFAYSVGTVNWALIIPLMNILGGVMSVVIVIQIVYTVYEINIKSR